MAVSIMWTYLMSLAARLISLRKKKGLSQRVMAEAIGIHVTQIKRYEAGTSQPSLGVPNKIALARRLG